MQQQNLIPPTPVKTVREHVREKMLDFNLRQAERERRRTDGGRRRRGAATEVQARLQFVDPAPVIPMRPYTPAELAEIENASLKS